MISSRGQENLEPGTEPVKITRWSKDEDVASDDIMDDITDLESDKSLLNGTTMLKKKSRIISCSFGGGNG